jgi:hypothetical protein
MTRTERQSGRVEKPANRPPLAEEERSSEPEGGLLGLVVGVRLQWNGPSDYRALLEGYMQPDARLEIAGLPTGDQFFLSSDTSSRGAVLGATDELFTEHRLRSISERTESGNL